MCMVNQFEFRQITNHTGGPNLQRLLLRLARYQIQLEYIRVEITSIADALGRDDPLSPEPWDAKQIDAIPVRQITSNCRQTDIQFHQDHHLLLPTS